MVILPTAVLSGLLSFALLLGEPAADQGGTPVSTPVPPTTPTSPPVDTEESEERMSEADRWMVYQYILGGAENAPMMLTVLVDQIDDQNNREEAWPLLSVYAAALGSRNKELLDHWIQQAVTMSDDFKMLFAYAVWYADFPKAASASARCSIHFRKITASENASSPCLGISRRTSRRSPSVHRRRSITCGLASWRPAKPDLWIGS